jgi:hypothetical protein
VATILGARDDALREPAYPTVETIRYRVEY